MPNKNLVSHKNKVDSLISRIDQYSRTEFNIELLSDLSKFACIQVSSYFEKAIFYILYDYSTKHSDKKIQSFTYNRLKKFTNASTGKIENLFESYCKEWLASIKNHPKYGEIKGSVNSLIKERNQIAHGEDSNISLSRLKQYYRNVETLICHIDTTLC